MTYLRQELKMIAFSAEGFPMAGVNLICHTDIWSLPNACFPGDLDKTTSFLSTWGQISVHFGIELQVDILVRVQIALRSGNDSSPLGPLTV